MKHIAVIAYWNWEFNLVVDEERENEPDESYKFYHIKSVSSIPKNIRFDRVVIGGACEDIFTYSEMEGILGAIPLNR